MKPIILLSLFGILISSSDEDYFGRYSSINSCKKISFYLSDTGVEELEIDGVAISAQLITYDYLGKYGNSQLFQLHFEDEQNFEHIIKMFIVMDGNKFIIASGYFMKFKPDNNNQLQVFYKESIEFNYEKP